MNAVKAKARELPEFVDDLVRIGVAQLVDQLGADPAQAKVVMAKIADGIVGVYARAHMYVPAGFGSRNQEIWRRYCETVKPSADEVNSAPFSRDRVEELAVEYQMTARQVYNVLGAMRVRDMASRSFPTAQLGLAGLDAPE